ncbi:MAG: hypothetical protein HOW73_02575 [Polyangiaceae bacterium]|nr:hypothetical protein [Polyangiaceae bacterium]
MKPSSPAAEPNPERRPVPWSIIAIAAAIAIGGTWVILDVMKPQAGNVTPKEERAPILGLDDEATKRAEEELMRPPSATPSASAPASSSAAPAPSVSAAPSASAAP